MMIMKTRQAKKMGVLALVVSMTALGSCAKDRVPPGDPLPAEEPAPQPGVPKGFGDSNDAPEGTVFTWPQGISVVGDIRGFDGYYEPELCGGRTRADQLDEGAYVLVCLSLRNDNEAPVTIALPAGLVFVSNDLAYQNGILLQAGTIVIAPKSVTYQPIGLYCLNENRDPATTESAYVVGPVTTYQPMLDFAGQVARKKVRPGQLPDFDISTTLQSCVYDICRNGRVSETYRRAFDAISNR